MTRRICATPTMKRGDQRGAGQRHRRRDRLAAPVGVQDGVLGKELLQGLQVALLGGREEPFEQGVAGRLVRVEARAPRLECLRARVTSWREFASLRSTIAAMSEYSYPNTSRSR